MTLSLFDAAEIPLHALVILNIICRPTTQMSALAIILFYFSFFFQFAGMKEKNWVEIFIKFLHIIIFVLNNKYDVFVYISIDSYVHNNFYL